MKSLILLLSCWVFSHWAIAQTCNSAANATTPTSRFQINNDGTATDTRTNLTWRRCPLGYTLSANLCSATDTTTFNWQDALQATDQHNLQGFAGFTDWRLPNIAELASIVEYRCSQPAINAAVFPDNDLASDQFWSSTPGGHNNLSLTVNFADGGGNAANRDTRQFPIRLVR